MDRLGPRLIAAALLGLAATGQAQRSEQITLDVTHPDAAVSVEADGVFGLASASTSMELDDHWLAIYRWIISAKHPERVTARLVDARWEPVEAAAPPLFQLPILRAHSRQDRSGLSIILLDLIPWRVRGRQLEVLRGGRVEVTIRHRAEDLLVRPSDYHFPDSRLSNLLRVGSGLPPGPPLLTGTRTPAASGMWLRIPIREDGLYRLTSDYLSAAGVDLATADLDRMQLLAPASLGRPLADQVGAPLEENLVEVAILVRDGGDDILFYGQGPRGYDLAGGELVFRQNPYTNTAYVWLYIPDDVNAPPGLRMASGPAYSAAGAVVAAGRTRTRREVDVFNGFDSGPVWHETAIGNGATLTIPLDAPGLRTTDMTRLSVRLRGGNERGAHRVSLVLNQVPLLTSTVWSAHGDIILAPGPDAIGPAVAAGQNTLSIQNITPNLDSQEEVWLDWVELDYGLDLTADEGALTFVVSPQGASADVQLSGFSGEPVVLDITAPSRPVLQQLGQSADLWQFNPTDPAAAQRYVAATEAALKTPGPASAYAQLNFANLRQPGIQADYIIITADTLLAAASELAKIHSEEVRPDLRLATFVATVDEIYEEFSAGQTDPFALRAFLRWAYENWRGDAFPKPQLVALFGDGDFDYRNLSGISRGLVPTIQVDGSSEINSRTVDDRFVYLDSVLVGTPLPAMGIGRIAASTPDEAEAVVALVRSYMVNPEPGAWRQRILLAADDPERPNSGEKSFIDESEWLTGTVPPYLQIIKIYLTEYAETLDPATNDIIKPDATEALISHVNRGVGLINFLGHGSATQWAQEQLLEMDRDRSRLRPGDRLPVWFAGTCTWGRFDHLEIASMSEVLTASSEYAAVGVISAVRAVFELANFRFISELFSQSFPGRQPAHLRLGQILQYSKGGGSSDEKFHLFGDPAILMAFPRDSLTLNPVAPDTLKVLGTATYSGSTGDGAVSAGEALVTVLDAPRRVKRTYRELGGDVDSIFYDLPGAPIFRGSVTIDGGAFGGSFVVPRDINYSGLPASIIAYGWSQEQGLLKEQIGFRDDLLIRGTADAIPDSIGPLTALYWDERALVSGDVLPEGSEVTVELQDPLGINLTGEVGHSIRVWVDDEFSAENMDPVFTYDIGEYTIGRFPFQFDASLTGSHELTVEAWDGANNKALTAWTLHLTLDEDLDVTALFNFPNPFSNATEFVYTLSMAAVVDITVFTLNGVKVITLVGYYDPSTQLQRLPWNGTDKYGDQIANGAYLYRLRAETLDDQTVTEWGRLARLR